MRDLGAIGTLQSRLPDAVIGAAEVLTHLGDPALLVALVVAVYWRARPGGARLLATALGAVGLVVALKGLLGLPRPPPGLRVVPADGYGFPSGHATGAAVVYGGLALLADRWSPRVRLVGATSVVGVVALSRVVLGVHYLLDVVAGVLLGAGFLLVAWTLSRDRVTPVFWLAAALGAAGVAVDGTPEAVLGFGTTLGVALSWTVVSDGSSSPVAPPAMAAAAVGLGALVGAARIAAAPPVLWAASTVSGAAIGSLPLVGHRWLPERGRDDERSSDRG